MLTEGREALDEERETLEEERDALEEGRETLAEERDDPAEERETLEEEREALRERISTALRTALAWFTVTPSGITEKIFRPARVESTSERRVNTRESTY